jgi:hypothetical protein
MQGRTVELRYQLTRRNIHDASDTLPKTPDKASWTVKGRPWASSAANVGIVVPAACAIESDERVLVGVE